MQPVFTDNPSKLFSSTRRQCTALLALCTVFAACSDKDTEPREVSQRLSNAVEVASSQTIYPPSQPDQRVLGPSAPLVTVPEPVDPRRLHYQALVIDTHADTPQSILDEDFDLTVRHDTGHLDLPRMVEGGLDAEFFSIWVDPDDFRNDAAYDRALALTSAVYDATWSTRDAVVVQDSVSLRAAVARGQRAILLGVEGAQALGTDEQDIALDRLRTLRALGARYMTLTWSNDNPVGHSSTG
ncbi:MAG: membrane dipeptidase, partial [Myxococcales bacterium]|nr:membrane dipeptidase [Myxococcales bacterium]